MIKKLLEFFSGIPMVGITTAIINAETGQGWIKESMEKVNNNTGIGNPDCFGKDRGIAEVLVF